jgi:hypothetical protein
MYEHEKEIEEEYGTTAGGCGIIGCFFFIFVAFIIFIIILIFNLK